MPASQTPKPAFNIFLSYEQHQSTGQTEVAYLHLAAFAAVERTEITDSESIWVNRLTGSLTTCSLLNDDTP